MEISFLSQILAHHFICPVSFVLSSTALNFIGKQLLL